MQVTADVGIMKVKVQGPLDRKIIPAARIARVYKNVDEIRTISRKYRTQFTAIDVLARYYDLLIDHA